MENGLRLKKSQPLSEIAKFSRSRLDKLPGEYKRFDNPHIYKVGISNKLKTERDKLIDKFKFKFK
jgi:nicotinate phosphoribosyltransferase